MKIRRQNLLTIVPIFLGMALISGALAYTTQRQEIMWGLREEISAMAIATSEFLDRESIIKLQRDPEDRKLKDGANRDAWSTRTTRPLQSLIKPLKRFQHFRGKQRFFLLTPDCEKVFFFFDGEKVTQTVSLRNENKNTFQSTYKSSELRDKLDKLQDQKSNVIITGIEKNDQDKAIMTAYVPIYDKGKLLSVLGVEVDAQFFFDRIREIRNKIFVITTAVGVFGVIVALFISRIITRKIGQLTQASLTIADGQYAQRVNIGTIQEVTDLSNTFNTMSSILEEVLSKTKRVLLEGEQFRTSADLASYFSQHFFIPIEDNFNKISVSVRSISEKPSGDFFGVFNVANGTYAVLGRVSGTDELDTVTSSSAAYTFIRQELNRHKPLQAFENVRKLFDLEAFQCLFWDKTGEKIWTYKPDDSVTSPEFILNPSASLKINSGEGLSTRLIEGSSLLRQNRVMIFHTLSETKSETVDLFIKNYSQIPPQELMKDILNVLNADDIGSLILLGKFN